ncbi:tyrosine-type recombinase/integrase [Streptomyces phaeochromogenes]
MTADPSGLLAADVTPVRRGGGGKQVDAAVTRRVRQERLARYPARSNPERWSGTTASVEQILTRLPRPPSSSERYPRWFPRRHGTEALLRWLETFPGATWQQRWQASPAPADVGSGWLEQVSQWTTGQPALRRRRRVGELSAGVLALLALDTVRPEVAWLVPRRPQFLRDAMAQYRDPEGLAALEELAGPQVWWSIPGRQAVGQIVRILAAKGGTVRDITVGDCLQLRALSRLNGSLFYQWLRELGQFPPNAPVSLRHHTLRTGQLSPADLVDRYRLRCRPVRDLIVEYLNERQPTVDYTSLEDLARTLASLFWADLERHHPGIDSLRLTPEMAVAWKQRIRVKRRDERLPDGTTIEVQTPRINYISLATSVRAFYLDVAEWAIDDPARWGPWVARCPISARELSHRKAIRQRKARTDQRTRARLPLLPVLVRHAEDQLKDACDRLAAVKATPPGETFTVPGQTLTRAGGQRKKPRPHETLGAWAYDTAGRRHDLGWEEHRAFWTWAAVEVLRHTGARIEEMLETTHHSLIQYTLPTTGEIVPLLQIAPSKTDEERVLLVTPELADVLSAIVSRVRGTDGIIPLVQLYDHAEKVWHPPMPALFQAPAGGHRKPITAQVIRRYLDDLITASGLTDNAGKPLIYRPHDFRRLFVTDAIMSGLPPHIAQIICGHKDINTTLGYNTIYPAEAIEAHRAFISRRRATRPSEEYRTPTSEEWDAFLGHFELRKISLGSCGRAFGTDCIHEHACIRCSLLRPDTSARQRLLEIRDNLHARIAEATREGWLGEIKGLEISLAGAEAKIEQLDADRAHRSAAVHLGMPAFPEIATRSGASQPPVDPPRRPRARPSEPQTSKDSAGMER